MPACHKENLSSVVRPGPEAASPFTPDQLLKIGGKYVRLKGIADYLRDDAAQEFVIAGWQATPKAGNTENLRAFQIQSGKWAVADFLKREQRRRGNEERYGREAYRVREGEDAQLEETVIDETAKEPLQALIAREDASRAMACLRVLSEREQEIAEAVIFGGQTFIVLARQLGVSKEYIGQIFRATMQKIKKSYFSFSGEHRL